ncbi:hypothetical protein Cabther_A2166 [Chloracidobacterium thermophilum B]|uniref:Uncharacterized protein n=3 Tax=Chloracidobacterium thermophilum TaxID=458033 RepID=G2LDP6_CHLTF|nr:hypothetical protein Cabther_A2166 [Chloracidobacterium thermophilum B]
MMITLRSRIFILSAVLFGVLFLAGTPQPAVAQNWDPWGVSDPRFNRRPPSEQWVRERGRGIGFQLGFEQGRQDRRQGFLPNFRNATYENAMQGFQREWRHDGNYRRGFRDGYRAGYEQGYNDLRGARGRGRGPQPAVAQNRDPWGVSDPRFNRRPPSEQWVRERGRGIGFQLGFEQGRQDRRQGFLPNFRNATYENAMQGFQREWRHDGNYRRGFRDGYRAGYEQGYNDLRGAPGRGRGPRGRGRGNDYGPDWRGNREWGWQQGRGNGRFD